MNTKLNSSDIKLFVLFYIVAIPVSIYFEKQEQILEHALDTLIYVVFSFTAVYFITFYLFPKFIPKKKYLQLILITTLLMIVWGFIELCLYRLTGAIDGQMSDWSQYSWLKLAVASLSSSAENVGILLGIFLGKKFFEAQLDIQKREKEKRENELRILKSQIDPHFLFNNLNTVDALIDSDPQTAKIYLNKLSSLYRYLIRTKDDDVVLLEDELDFAKHYVYLIEKRFGSAYQFIFSEKILDINKFIPPGALQTILENVIKHNIAKPTKPIVTRIEISENDITIENNINRKIRNSESTKTGLNNLKARYRLLTDKIPLIESDDTFRISIPLIRSITT